MMTRLKNLATGVVGAAGLLAAVWLYGQWSQFQTMKAVLVDIVCIAPALQQKYTVRCPATMSPASAPTNASPAGPRPAAPVQE